MALETAPYINGLVASNPAAGDPLANADDHMRLIKAALLATFPNITGPVTATHTALNVAFASLTGVQTLTNKTLTSPVISLPTITGGNANAMSVGVTTPAPGSFTTLDASGALSFLPSNVGILWWGTAASVPAGWKLCDGTNGTPDMRGAFARGATGSAVGGTGGSADAVAVAHNHTATSVVTDPGHAHTSPTFIGGFSDSGRAVSGSSTPGVVIQSSTSVTGVLVATTVTAAGVSGVGANLPPFKEWHYIMRI